MTFSDEHIYPNINIPIIISSSLQIGVGKLTYVTGHAVLRGRVGNLFTLTRTTQRTYGTKSYNGSG